MVEIKNQKYSIKRKLYFSKFSFQNPDAKTQIAFIVV